MRGAQFKIAMACSGIRNGRAFSKGTFGLMVLASASHAEDRQFDPGHACVVRIHVKRHHPQIQTLTHYYASERSEQIED